MKLKDDASTIKPEPTTTKLTVATSTMQAIHLTRLTSWLQGSGSNRRKHPTERAGLAWDHSIMYKYLEDLQYEWRVAKSQVRNLPTADLPVCLELTEHRTGAAGYHSSPQ